MNSLSKLLTRSLFLTAVLMFGGLFPSHAAELQKLTNAKLINNSANDGDSFFVESAGKSFHVRLYFVDCPETSVGFKSDAQRAREQMRHFGLPSAERTRDSRDTSRIFPLFLQLKNTGSVPMSPPVRFCTRLLPPAGYVCRYDE